MPEEKKVSLDSNDNEYFENIKLTAVEVKEIVMHTVPKVEDNVRKLWYNKMAHWIMSLWITPEYAKWFLDWLLFSKTVWRKLESNLQNKGKIDLTYK